MSLRVGSLLVSWQACAAALTFGASSACSSDGADGSGVVPDTDAGGAVSSGGSGGAVSSGSSGGSSGGESSSGSSSGVVDSVPDGGCPAENMTVLGVHIAFDVTWPDSTATATGTGPANIWLLSLLNNSGTGNLISMGPTHSCGATLPDIVLNDTGKASVCAPGKACGNTLQIQLPAMTFEKIMRTFPTSGSQTGWNPGDTITTSPALGLLGLADTSTYASPTQAWPPYCASNCTPNGKFMMGEVTDDDNDGHPGITAYPKSDGTPCPASGPCKYSYPPTSVQLFQVPPLADQVYVVSRNMLSITALRMSDCTHGTGTAKITLFDNHVVGCHQQSPAAECTSNQVTFLDQNRTIYGPDKSHVASESTPIAGVVTLQQLPTTATCTDVLKIN